MKPDSHHNPRKKYLIVVLALLFAGGLGAYAADLGDVNSSGTVDIVDALLVAQYYVGLNPAGFDTSVADVNCSGAIDIVDALLIAQYYVGLTSSFSCGVTATPTVVPTSIPTIAPTAVPTSVPTVGPTVQPATGFVQRVGNRLALDGKTFFYNGANQYYLFYKSHYMVDDVLNDAAALHLTVMRTWGFCDGKYQGAYCFQPSPGVYDEPTFQNMDYTISKSAQLGIKLIIPLVNNWDDMGGMNQYVAWAGGGAHDDFYTNATCKTTYKNYVNHFLNRVNSITGVAYKNDPTIMMWELGNEPRCSSDTTGVKLQAWIDEMAAYIKSIDSNHLLGTGEEGFYPSFGAGTDFIKNNSSPNIDICSAHLYPSWWSLTLDQATAYIQAHANDAHNTLGKPFYLGEYGWAVTNGGVAGRDTAYTAWYNMLDTTNSDGANFWILSGLQDDGTYYQDYDGFTTYITDTSTCALISAFSTKQAAKAGKTLDTTPPTVGISSPSNNGSVSGTVSITGTATDNLGLAKVEVALNGGIWRAATGATSWTYSWDSTAWINGTNTITAKATDNQNNTSTTQVLVTVSNSAVTSTSYEMTASKSQDDGYWLIYTLHVTNKSSATITGNFKIRFFISPEGTITISSHYDDSTTYSSTVTPSAGFTVYGGGQSYYDIDLGSRTFAPGAYIGYKGDIGISTSGFVSSNDWSSSQITGSTVAVINHVALYKDGVIVAGYQP